MGAGGGLSPAPLTLTTDYTIAKCDRPTVSFRQRHTDRAVMLYHNDTRVKGDGLWDAWACMCCALLCGGHNYYDSTAIRRPIDCVSEVIKVTIMRHISE